MCCNNTTKVLAVALLLGLQDPVLAQLGFGSIISSRLPRGGRIVQEVIQNRGRRRYAPYPTSVRQLPREAVDAATRKQRATEKTKRRAFIVATRDYAAASQLPSLAGTNREADLIAEALQKGGFREEDIVIVYDDAQLPNWRPSSQNIRARFQEFVGHAADGIALVYLIGHGISAGGESFYCPQDATDEMLEEPANSELVSIRALATTFSEECKAENKVIVVDACRNLEQDRHVGLVQSLEELEEPAKDVWLMSSCSEGQRSWISNTLVPGERHPIFTHYVAKGLEGAADLVGDNDGRVGLFELFSYASTKTNAETTLDQPDKGFWQSPELFGLAAPFELAVVGNFVARRTLTTSDVDAEARRSADQIADDMLANLRVAEFYYRTEASKEDLPDEAFEELSRNHRNYLSYLLGNRLEAALQFDEACELAHVARGITYRATGMYEEALAGFQAGGENFDLFVRADGTKIQRYLARDDQGRSLVDEHGIPMANLSLTTNVRKQSTGSAFLYDVPGGEVKYRVNRETKVRIVEVAEADNEQWLLVRAINDVGTDLAWIREADVHWLPEAVDVYTPQTAMRPFGSGGFASATRFDYAANRIHNLANVMDRPALRLRELAQLMYGPSGRLRNAAGAVARPTNAINDRIYRINRIGSWFGFSIPYVSNPAARFLYTASSYAAIPAGYVSYGAGIAGVPAGYVRTAGGYVQMPSSYIRNVQGWATYAGRYQTGHRQTVTIEKNRKKLKNRGKLSPVEARPIRISLLPWETERPGGAAEIDELSSR